MILGVGVDVVSIERLRRALERTPGIAERVFTDDERATAYSRGSPEASLAARFAAKEACRKAIGQRLPWKAVEVVSSESGAPSLRVPARPDLRLHLTLSHDAGVALAFVVAES
jgi:holo-[acyl-carrier protein] synthase